MQNRMNELIMVFAGYKLDDNNPLEEYHGRWLLPSTLRRILRAIHSST